MIKSKLQFNDLVSKTLFFVNKCILKKNRAVRIGDDRIKINVETLKITYRKFQVCVDCSVGTLNSLNKQLLRT